MPGWRSRLKVIGLGFAGGAFWSLWVALGVPYASYSGPGEFATVWASVLAGPLADLWLPCRCPDGCGGEALVWGLFCAPLLAAHPLAPRWQTGVLTTFGVALWLLLGFMVVWSD